MVLTFQHPVKPEFISQYLKEASKLKKEMMKNLNTEQWSLHFDGKHLNENEYQVVVLKNERMEVKLAALCSDLFCMIGLLIDSTTR